MIDLNSTTKERIEVTQINTNKARLAQIELLNKLNKCRNPFIIITQEPYCYKSTLSLLPQNAKTIPTNRQGQPRVSISASNRLHMEEITELSHRDLVAGLVTLEGKKTIILSIYLDITKETIPEFLSKAIDYCKARRYAILIGIDTNAHSDIWGHSNNKRGHELVDYIIQEGFELHNNGKAYTYECSTGKSVIDLTLSWNLKTGLNDWKVSKEINHSDHNSIKFNLETELETIPIHRPWNKADWEMFRKELTDKKIYVPNKTTPQRLENIMDQFYKQIGRALDKASPKQK